MHKAKKRSIFLSAVILMLLIVAALLPETVFAQTTYVITDGSRVVVHTTSTTDPEIVLGEAGLELGDNDGYTTASDDGVEQINIRRGQKLLVDYYGQQIQVDSAGETVGQLLDRLGLTWEEGDVISAPLDAAVYDAMELRISRVVQEDQIYTMTLPHETIHCFDDSLPEGTQKVLTEGTDGQILCEATVTYCNGIETQRKVLHRQVISQPVNEIIAIGTGSGQETAEETQKAVIGDGIITLPTGEVLTYTEKVTCLATAYHCEGYVGTTATGTRARVGAIAVDPEVFPYGTRFYIATKDGEYIYGIATAEDCGDKRFIYDTRLDLYFNTKKECVQFGARSCDVYILG